jgi:hypothetical protein
MPVLLLRPAAEVEVVKGPDHRPQVYINEALVRNGPIQYAYINSGCLDLRALFFSRPCILSSGRLLDTRPIHSLTSLVSFHYFHVSVHGVLIDVIETDDSPV